MRDPNRIKTILDKIGNAWRCAPDLRLGQLLMNAAESNKKDLYYIEDEILAEMVFDLIKESSSKKGNV